MSTVDRLVGKIKAKHFACPPASARSLKRLRGMNLPPDMLRFYELTDGAFLYRKPDIGYFMAPSRSRWNWKIAPAKDLESVQDVGYIQRDSPHYRRSRFWVSTVNVQDGDYLAVNVEPGHAGEVLDCFHETVGKPGQTSIVARSFTEMLQHLLASPKPFWLSKKHASLGEY